MKVLTALAVASTMFVGIGPSFAQDMDWAIPKQCFLPETKAEHPLWYRDGGYCTVPAWMIDKTAPGHLPPPDYIPPDVVLNN